LSGKLILRHREDIRRSDSAAPRRSQSAASPEAAGAMIVLISFLSLLLAQFGKESNPETVVPKVSQEILAEMIGTTRSRVSFFMNRFRKLGFIEYNGEIRVHNSLLNIFLHE
jgi:CRP-like cAMP-binding protein